MFKISKEVGWNPLFVYLKKKIYFEKIMAVLFLSRYSFEGRSVHCVQTD